MTPHFSKTNLAALATPMATSMAAYETKTFLNPHAREFFPINHHHHPAPVPYFSTDTPIFIPQQPYCFAPTLSQCHEQQLIITPVPQLLATNNSEKQQLMTKKPVFNRSRDQIRSTRSKRKNCAGYGFVNRPVQSYIAWKRKETKDDDENNNNSYYYDHSRQVQCFNNGCPNKSKLQHHPLLPVREDGEETTIMIKNIPAKYCRSMLVDFLDKHCLIVNNNKDAEGEVQNGIEYTILAFDFVYLPIDFRSGLNKGYAFVNFTSPKAAWKFSVTASNQKWDLFQSHKRREIVYARLQGKEELEKHFESMHFPCEYEEVLPVFYSPPRDGSNNVEPSMVGKLYRCRY